MESNEPSDSNRMESAGGVLVAGATGLVGRRLVPALAERFSWVRTLSRGASASRRASGDAVSANVRGVETRTWDGIDPGALALDGVDAIVHLAGEPIFGGRPTAERLARVRSSRIDSTTKLVERILERPPEERPKTLVCASAVGIYGDAGSTPLDESAAPGAGFLADVCRDWEARAQEAESAGLRVVRLRIGVVLAREGGALGLMKLPFSLGFGGRLGSGDQFFSWIHVDDLVRAILFCLDREIEGAVNAVAPEAVTNREFTSELGRVLRRPTLIPVPAFAVRAALGEVSGELLGSRRVVPGKLIEAGFEYEHPTLRSALEEELR